MEKVIMLAFKIISDAGAASAGFLSAISMAEEEKIDDSLEAMKEAESALVAAHKVQTELLQKEVNGQSVEYSLLMVHAQDHLMNAILLKDLAYSIIRLNKKVLKLSE